jgi:hypothetical protein
MRQKSESSNSKLNDNSRLENNKSSQKSQSFLKNAKNRIESHGKKDQDEAVPEDF